MTIEDTSTAYMTEAILPLGMPIKNNSVIPDRSMYMHRKTSVFNEGFAKK